jgi:protein-tyrosine phosphatase
MTIFLDDRLVPFEACFNFRDLGGYETREGRTVRWGRIYRSDTLHRLTPPDITVLEGLGLRAIIDLRAGDEIADHGGLPTGVVGPDWHHRPLVASMVLRPGNEQALPAGVEALDAAPGEGYMRFVGDGEMAVSVLSLVAESDGPAVFHCTAGKDRTGVIAAMILDLLGVSDETIAQDYMLTAQTGKRSSAWISENEPEFAAFLAQIPRERRKVRPDPVLGFLERVRSEHGSVAALVESRGMTRAQIETFRSDLLE